MACEAEVKMSANFKDLLGVNHPHELLGKKYKFQGFSIDKGITDFYAHIGTIRKVSYIAGEDNFTLIRLESNEFDFVEFEYKPKSFTWIMQKDDGKGVYEGVFELI